MISLLIRNLIFTILQPGLVAGLIPFLFLKAENKNFLPSIPTFSSVAGSLLMICGFFVLINCILRFASEGKGTLSPFDPTKKLVVKGLYRYSRNPMYVGVLLLLIGETVFFQSIFLLVYTVFIFLCFQLFIILHEEPRLKRDFGQEYENYCRKIKRWL
ncbi:MAG TPA: isoprenylcysteine carboxylmethyltransferase family protein [Pyrinomonadaceae bacterium]|nr:isoprenylcysteine carboxylmethyltransferase family protein [Pyrinomonadaceae bacterium]